MVGALIALSSAMFTAGYSCIMSKLASTEVASLGLELCLAGRLPQDALDQLSDRFGHILTSWQPFLSQSPPLPPYLRRSVEFGEALCQSTPWSAGTINRSMAMR